MFLLFVFELFQRKLKGGSHKMGNLEHASQVFQSNWRDGRAEMETIMVMKKEMRSENVKQSYLIWWQHVMLA